MGGLYKRSNISICSYLYQNSAQIYRIYGFKKKYNPLIFSLDGKFIGNLENFKSLAFSKFGIVKYGNEITKEVKNIKKLFKANIQKQINMKQVLKQMEKQKKVATNKRTFEEKLLDCLK